MNFSIFPMFFSFYGTYTKIFIIFGSAHDFFYTKLNIKQKLHKRKKKPLSSERPGNRPAGRPASARPTRALRALSPPHAVTDRWVPLVRTSLPLSLRDADGVAPPVSSSFLARGGSAAAPAVAGEV